MDMRHRNEQTRSLNLRSLPSPMIDRLYELKALRKKPICDLVAEALTQYLDTQFGVRATNETAVHHFGYVIDLTNLKLKRPIKKVRPLPLP
jgi:hypothetical protein